MNKLLMILLILINVTNNDECFVELERELKKESINLRTDSLKITNNFSILFPTGLNGKFAGMMDSLISRDKIEYNCPNTDGNVEVVYEISFYTESFLSIKKTVNMMFCYPQDILHIEYYNFIDVGGDIYKLEIINGFDIENILSLNKSVECEFEKENVSISLFFKENKPYISIVKDKVCGIESVISFREGNFMFTPSTLTND